MSSTGPQQDRSVRYGLLAVTGVALLLRLPGHLGSGLWFDEIWMLVEIGRASLSEVVGSYPGDFHHPLFSLLAWLSLRAFGESVWALRLPAVVFGALSVGMLWLYARRVTRPVEVWLATALLATSYHHVWFSQNARGYTLLLFLTLAAMYCFEDLVAAGGSRRSLVGYALSMGLAVYTHLTAVFVAVAHLLAVAVREWTARRGPGSWRAPMVGLAAAAAVSLVLYAPMAHEVVSYFWVKAGSPEELAIEQPAQVPAVWTSARWAVEAAARSLGLGLFGGLAALGLAGLVALRGAVDLFREAPWRLVAWALPGPLLAGVLGLLGRNLWPRLFFLLAGFVVLVLARGWLGLVRTVAPPRRGLGRAEWTAAAALWLVWSTLLPRAYELPKQDFEGARAYLEQTRRPGDVVATTGLATLPYQSYLVSDYQAVESAAELDALARRAERVYVVTTVAEHLRSRQPGLASELAARGREVARFPGSVGGGDVVVLHLAATGKGSEER